MSSEPGSFGYVRKHDIHTGVDLYCEENSEVMSICDGIVVRSGFFTGPETDSPWWNTTYYVLVETKIGFILYGEIDTTLVEGDLVTEGSVIGVVRPVLKKDKGVVPSTSMLHMELYNANVEPQSWALGEERPARLLDVGELLDNLFTFSEL